MSETPVEYLRFVAEAKGLKGEAVKKQIQEVIEQTGLEQRTFFILAEEELEQQLQEAFACEF